MRDDVLVEIEWSRFVAVAISNPIGNNSDPTHLPGLTLPGLANVHSHAFHQALRGRTQRGRGTF